MPTAELPIEMLSEEEHWRVAFAFEDYVVAGYDYEDYAPAYCVGFVGFHQYGGSFEEAGRCLRANWERIRGDSRLSFEEALPAIRAAWARVRSNRELGPTPVAPPERRQLQAMSMAA